MTLSEFSKRFKSGYQHYQHEVLAYKNMTLVEAFNSEQHIITQLQHKHYKPKKRFGGWNECFKLTNNDKQSITQYILT
jgi:hypothetical protein